MTIRNTNFYWWSWVWTYAKIPQFQTYFMSHACPFKELNWKYGYSDGIRVITMSQHRSPQSDYSAKGIFFPQYWVKDTYLSSPKQLLLQNLKQTGVYKVRNIILIYLSTVRFNKSVVSMVATFPLYSTGPGLQSVKLQFSGFRPLVSFCSRTTIWSITSFLFMDIRVITNGQN